MATRPERIRYPTEKLPDLATWRMGDCDLYLCCAVCSSAAILDDPMECSRGERLAITLAKEGINRASNRSTTGKLEVDIFELLRDSEYETGETSKFRAIPLE